MSELKLDLDDIQSGVLRPRPSPYAATYVLVRIDEARAGCELLRRLRPAVASVNQSGESRDTWVGVSLSCQGLRKLGVPQASLDTFAPEFQRGMAARAEALGDVGESAPENWEKPLGSPDVHIVVTAVAPDTQKLEAAFREAQENIQDLAGIKPIWRQDCHVLLGEREAFGFKDGIGHPAIEGSGIPGTNPDEVPLKAGELVIGYPDELSEMSAIPQPDVLGRNGTYVVFRKLHQRVAAFRQYLKRCSANTEEEEFIAAKMMGRWRSGAPLARCPMHDDPALGADVSRNNAFSFRQDDPIGYKTPLGSHIRRMNPRDAEVAGLVRIHRMIRRGTSYGPLLPEGVLEDDGVDRGLMFAFVGAHLGRQFDFVQAEWMNNSEFFGGKDGKDPVAGAADGEGTFDVPKRPIRRQLKGLSRFVITRGGEYCFMPGLRALDWLAKLA